MDLDPVIHVPVRLRLMAHLAGTLDDEQDQITFGRVQTALGLTAGNLTSHLSRLEQAGYVEIEKSFAGRRPVTHLRLTREGRQAYATYRRALLDLLDQP